MALTSQQEVFAKKIALENLNQSAAYSAAYNVAKMAPKTITDRAHDLAKLPEVAARIDVLRERATAASVKAAAHTRDAAINEAQALLEDAHALGQISAGVAAAKLKAQLAGHLDEKKQDPKGQLDEMDITSLLELKKAVEDKVESSREALAMVEVKTPVIAAPAPIRRVI